ncbi:MAG: PAS/PAC sensor signal transduction histidine [Geobacteraceae bacterium]|nr:MAG: PAS/PAC sensor signal transduction histidine [Geobacteraceae bacterium]
MFEKVSEIKAQLEQSDQKLQACLARLRDIMTKSPHGILIVDMNRTILFANPAAAAIFGSKAKELLDKPLDFPVEPDKTTELKLRSRDGKTVEVEVWTIETEWKAEKAHFVALHDISERKKNEQELRKLYRAMMESPVMVMITDAGGNIEYVNPRFTETTGYTFAEVAGKNPRFLKSDKTQPQVYQELWEAIAGGKDWRGEFINRKKDGDLYIESASIAPVIDINGVISNFIAVKEDITERRRAEEKIEKLNADLAARASELEAANKELEAFNYTVSDDLRRPIININSFCQVIQELCGDKLDERCNGYLNKIYDWTLEMSHLIDTLLNFSRLTSSELRRETVDLGKMAKAITAGLKTAEPARRVIFRIAEGLTVNGDKRLLWVVLENLLDNAWKYTGKREEAVIEFGMTEIEGMPAYFVRDNGTGFDMAYAEKLFIPFEHLPGSDEYEGHGIGLATVERIISRHGGRVWAKGEPAKGATFYFTVRAEEAHNR